MNSNSILFEQLESRIIQLESRIDDLMSKFIDLKSELDNYDGSNEFVLATLKELENILGGK